MLPQILVAEGLEIKSLSIMVKPFRDQLLDLCRDRENASISPSTEHLVAEQSFAESCQELGIQKSQHSPQNPP